MIKLIERYFKHKDERGSIEGLINIGNWKELNIITSIANTIRGNHYHKHAQELFIILEGEIEVTTQRIKDDKLFGEIFVNKVKDGDVFIVEPMVNHIFSLKKDSKWINALSTPIDQDSPDIFRVGP